MVINKGVIGIASHFLGRYREFDLSLGKLNYPTGSEIDWQISLNIPMNYNNMIRTMMLGSYDWVWILGDDHMFHPDILNKLLAHDVDVVIPLYLRTSPPHRSGIHGKSSDGYPYVEDTFLDGKTGLVDITDKTASNAGMLIRRHVIDGIDAPWFENCSIDRELGRSDLIFSEKIGDNGFKLFIDTDNPLGHITHVCVWPTRDSENKYGSVLKGTHEMYNTGSYYG